MSKLETKMISKRMEAIPESSTVAIADAAARLREKGVQVVDFSAGRAAEHSPAIINQAAVNALGSGFTHQTPARGLPQYLDACQSKLLRENNLELDAAENIIATLGCKQGLVLSLMATIDIGDEVLIESPCFVSYAPTIRMLGGVPIAVPLVGESRPVWTDECLREKISAKSKAILFCSPGNPTGVVHSEYDLQLIVDIAIEFDLLVIADEIYEAVCWGGRKHLSIFNLDGMCERTIGLMGMTKTYSMGGWRIGYAYSSASIIDAMVKAQQHLMTCAGSFTQLGAAKALQPDAIETMQLTWAEWESRCVFMCKELSRIRGLSVNSPEGGFYAWVDISETNMSSVEFCSALLQEKNVAVVPGSSFGIDCDHFIRITCVRSRVELEEGLLRIQQFLS